MQRFEVSVVLTGADKDDWLAWNGQQLLNLNNNGAQTLSTNLPVMIAYECNILFNILYTTYYMCIYNIGMTTTERDHPSSQAHHTRRRIDHTDCSSNLKVMREGAYHG